MRWGVAGSVVGYRGGDYCEKLRLLETYIYPRWFVNIWMWEKLDRKYIYNLGFIYIALDFSHVYIKAEISQRNFFHQITNKQCALINNHTYARTSASLSAVLAALLSQVHPCVQQYSDPIHSAQHSTAQHRTAQSSIAWHSIAQSSKYFFFIPCTYVRDI